MAEGTAAALGDARVFVLRTNLAASTSADGRYTISNVPAGSFTVRVIRLGYEEQQQLVTLAPGTSVSLDFTMTKATLNLDPVVVTATGDQRKVELGHSVSTIEAVTRVEETPIFSFADLLVAKAPGVIVGPPNMTGSAPVIRIRGFNSLSLSNAPIVVVDGVRYLSGAMAGHVGGTNYSFLNSLSPEEIENIEIVKGPSAGTLYGTDAANGVIVVTTKQGRAGTAKWTWFAENGRVEDRNTYAPTDALWGHNPTTGNRTRCQLATMTLQTCVRDSLTSINIPMDKSVSPLGTGTNSNYGLQVSGGSDAVRYFVAGDLFNETGPYTMPAFAISRLQDSLHTPVRDEWLHPEALQRANVRANFSATVTPTFDLTVNVGLANSDQRLPQTDNNGLGIGVAMLATFGTDHAGLDYKPVGALSEGLHGYRGATPAEIFQDYTTQHIQRITGSTSASWRPLTWMQNSATIGIDDASQLALGLCRLGECTATSSTSRAGVVSDESDNNRSFGAKVLSTSFWNPRSSLSFKSTIGGEYGNNEADVTLATGTGLPPGVAVMTNVALLNYAYGVPVKLYATTIVLSAAVLLIYDAPRLIAVFVSNQTAPPAPLSSQWQDRIAAPLRWTIKGLVVGSVLLSSVAAMRGSLNLSSAPSGLDGLWIVTSFAQSGQAADSARWSQVIVRGNTVTIRISSNRFVSCKTTPTSTPDAMTAACSGNRRAELRWTTSGATAQIDGTFDGAHVTASARRTDRSDYRLMQGKFHWIFD